MFCIAVFRSNGLALGLNIKSTALKQRSPEDWYPLCITVYAPVISIPGPRAGNIEETPGLKCRDLISDERRQCRGFNFQPIHGHIYSKHILDTCIYFNI